MPTEVIMPALGMSQDTGRLLAWLKEEGDTVQAGEPLMEIETDKATVEVEAESDGTLANVSAHAGDDIPVGNVIALILAEGEAAPAQEPAKTPTTSAAPAAPSATPDGKQQKTATPVAMRVASVHDVDISLVPASGERITRADVEAYVSNGASHAETDVILASPKARRLAREREIDIAQLTGSGPDGAVLTADVLAYEPITETEAETETATAPAEQPAAVQTGRMWKRMADRLTDSWQTIPHFYLKRDVDATAFMVWRTRLKQRADIKVTYTDLLVQVVAKALENHPHVNGSWNGEGVVFNDDINVGLAVAVDEGLLVPVIHQANERGVLAIAEARAGVVTRSLDGRLKPADLQGGTFTISNLGMYGIDEFKAIVNPPQAAILAVGNIVEKVVPHEGATRIQSTLTLSLSCDHRVVDGARGAAFMQTLAHYIQDPVQMMD